MRRIVTFLGVRPKETSYAFGGTVYSARVFPEALRQFVEYDEMLVLLTDQARSGAWPILAALGDPRIKDLSIPRGETTAEMWQIFDTILANVCEGDSVVFDITHGLRSLPFLVFLFAAYLKTAKRVTIPAVYYGALDLANADAGRPAPVIDLSEFVAMLDWLTATDQFVETGDGRRLAALLKPRHYNLPAAAASRKLNDISLAAFLCQPFKLMREVSTLPEVLENARPALSAHARPFGVLQSQIAAAFSPFSADPDGDPQARLSAEFRMIEWYYQKRQWIQAVTLAREWLLDAVTLRLGLPLDFGHKPRNEVERALSGLHRLGKKDNGKPFTREDLNPLGRIIHDTWPEFLQLKDACYNIEEVRNRLDHAEHQNDKWSLKAIQNKVDQDIMPQLCDIAKLWHIA